MGINIFDRQFFGDLQQFDTSQIVNVTINEPSTSITDSIINLAIITPKLFFNSIIRESLNFISRIKDTEDVSI